MFHGIFFSDSGIIYLTNCFQEIDSEESINGLRKILEMVSKLNKQYLMPSSDNEYYHDIKFMTKCAIAFGDLKIMELNELPNVEKQPLYGQAFVDAYESAEGISEHKMQIGEVRITYKNLPSFRDKLQNLNRNNSPFKNLYRIGNSHAYFSWAGMEDPSKKLDKIFKEGEKMAKQVVENEMDKLYKKQLNLYTNWLNRRN